MFSSMRIAAASAALAGLALCAAPAQAFVYGAYHVMPTPSYLAKMAKIGRAPVMNAGLMNYYGGSVFTSSKVVSVMWGFDVPSFTVNGVPAFTSALVNSIYVDQMAEYDTHLRGINGHRGTYQDIGRGTFVSQVTFTPRNKNTSLTDADIQAELKHQIKVHNLPAPDLNTLYMIYFPKNVTINLDGLISCQDFGAYHFATVDTKLSKKNIFYAVEPACTYGFSTITFIASHEFAEATTDNVPTPGSNPDFPQAWNDADGFEIGDKCGTSGTLTQGQNHFTVTQYFLNSTGQCSTGDYTSP
ncbi:MAG: hypothetical protein JO261_02315 [Alphaproteobacteria bacterium]|nr:hypothetical protein [Alphaproteobacteria bacterium]MBV9692513.1 hypothetical protein [Alphaproteobacteria bacterium]